MTADVVPAGMKIRVQITNKKGLHARAAAKFVKTAGSFQARVKVRKLHGAGASEFPEVSGSSILGLMMLAAETGSEIEISAEGEQAAEALGALEALIGRKFDEE